MNNYPQSSDRQPLFCKKCGNSGFYYPTPEQDTGSWSRYDKYERLQAFDPQFNVPHWWVCPAHPKGLEHRRKIEDDRLIGSGQSTIEKSLDLTPHPPHIESIPQDIKEIKDQLKEIKALLVLLVQRTEPVG